MTGARDPSPDSVAVLGAGTIGAAWAAFFALSGLNVKVADPSGTAEQAVAAMLERARPVMDALGLLSSRATIPTVVADIAPAVEGAAHVQEALPESIELKRSAYAQVEASVSPRAVIASSSSGLMPSVLQAAMRHPERLLVAHPCNPPYLMPVVEIVAGNQTADWAVQSAKVFYEGLHKRVIVLRREVTGHLVNRLQAALWREAVHLVAEGCASVADVDLAVTEGLGARWAVCGPHEIFHLAGGPEGMAGFLQRLGPAVETWWADLGAPALDSETRAILVEGMADAAQGRSVQEMAAARDARMIPVMAAARSSEPASPAPTPTPVIRS